MNPSLLKLNEAVQKPDRLIIGLMSGTSMDGLDVALCKVYGADAATRVELLEFETAEYQASYTEQLRAVFSKREIDLETLTLLNPWVAEVHADLVLQCLKKWHLKPENIDFIASHGQTVYHAPQLLHKRKEFRHATLQIGDGDHIAVRTGINTLSDFRQKHIAAGGEGAPLAVYGDYFVFSDSKESRILVNIGGIANFTFLPAGAPFSSVFSTDTGPGNTLMDAYIQAHFTHLKYDKNAEIAAGGKVHPLLLQALKSHGFFKQNFPKTIGPELFNLNYLSSAQSVSGTQRLPAADVLATLCRFSAETLAEGIIKSTGKQRFALYVSGGGIHNPLMMKHLKDMFANHTVQTTAALGIHPDAKEAVLFAVLANQCLCSKQPASGLGTAVPLVGMGKISLAP